MKTLMLLAALSMTTNVNDLCKSYGELAQTIMIGRQNQVPLTEILEIAKVNEDATNIVMMAYKQPAYSSPEMQMKAVREFRNDIELECLMSNATAN